MRSSRGIPSPTLVVFLLAGCAPADDGPWVGTITIEGDATTVVNESGSVWGGPAELVEELSIGVEAGEPEYMFGQIADVYVDDAGIWVVDEQTPAVRLFDRDGNHVRDLGGHGEGPGEYTRPHQLATGSNGRTFLVDAGTSRINVYTPEGEFIDALPLGRGVAWSGYVPLVIDAQGTPSLVYRDYDLLDPSARSSPSFVLRGHGPNGPTGEPIPIPEGQVAGPGYGRFGPMWVWNLTPTGGLLSGTSASYRFEIRPTDGRPTIVQKSWEPVPVSPEETAYLEHLATLRRSARRAAPIPETKQAFLALLGAGTGETWVLRQGRGFKVPECNERPATYEEAFNGEPCWRDSVFFDVFGEDGRFLGRLDAPSEMLDQMLLWARTPHFENDRVTAVAIDDAGTITVKRYRVAPKGR